MAVTAWTTGHTGASSSLSRAARYHQGRPVVARGRGHEWNVGTPGPRITLTAMTWTPIVRCIAGSSRLACSSPRPLPPGGCEGQ